MLEYQMQNSGQTLAEGIAEYSSVNGKHFRTRKMTAEAETFFEYHDVAHVVFGCDISLNDELVVKISSIFGTTAGLNVLKGYNLPEAKEDYEGLSLRNILLTVVHSLFLVPRTIWRCIRMQNRWKWDNHHDYLEMPLKQIREHFGIRVAH